MGKIQFKKAVKHNAKLRLAIAGPSGSGKTFTLLKLLTELCGPGNFAIVDTERGSASLYAHTNTCGGAGTCEDPSHFDFQCIEPDIYDPRELIETVKAAHTAGLGGIGIDSLTHYWEGPGGELEMVDLAAKRKQGNSFAGWKDVTPVHNELIRVLTSTPIHVLASMRSKTEWVTEKDERTGKTIPRKVGLQPIMRSGIEFEFTMCGDMDQDNVLTITKSRCSALSNAVISKPGAAMIQTLKIWLGSDEANTPQPPPLTTTPAPKVAPIAPVPQPQPTTPTPADPTPASTPTQQPSVENQFKRMVAAFGEMKKRIGVDQYYKILKQFEVDHANDFRSMSRARDCYDAMEVAAKVNGQ